MVQKGTRDFEVPVAIPDVRAAAWKSVTDWVDAGGLQEGWNGGR
jgi:hypothetical protein